VIEGSLSLTLDPTNSRISTAALGQDWTQNIRVFTVPFPWDRFRVGVRPVAEPLGIAADTVEEDLP